jgi:hypothetical protein
MENAKKFDFSDVNTNMSVDIDVSEFSAENTPTLRFSVVKTYQVTVKSLFGKIFDVNVEARSMELARKEIVSMFGATVEILFIDVSVL